MDEKRIWSLWHLQDRVVAFSNETLLDIDECCTAECVSAAKRSMVRVLTFLF